MDLDTPILKRIEDHYRENFSSLVKRIKFRTGSVEGAEDVVQEAYLRALRYQHAFITGTNYDFWFSRILSNCLNDYLKAEREYSGMDDIEDEEGEPVENTNIPDAVKREIQFEINQLTPEHKEIVELILIYGYDRRQVVQIVDVKYKTLDQIMQRFKNRIKEKYMQ